MVPAVHNAWLGVMALAFALAMVVWIGLVFWADRHPHGYEHDGSRRREVLGGSFVAREGGRQVVPDPREPLQSEDAEGAESAENAEGTPMPGPRSSADEPVAHDHPQR